MGHEDPAPGGASGRGCCFVRVCAAGGRAGGPAHPAPAVSHRQAGPLPGTSAAGSPPGGSRPAGPSSPPRAADWAVPGSVISNLDTAPGSPYHRGRRWSRSPSTMGRLRSTPCRSCADPRRRPGTGQLRDHRPGRRLSTLGILRAENAAGMVLVNHTWTHVDLCAAARRGAGRPRSTAPAACCAASPAMRPVRFGCCTAWPIRRWRAQLRMRGLAELGLGRRPVGLSEAQRRGDHPARAGGPASRRHRDLARRGR